MMSKRLTVFLSLFVFMCALAGVPNVSAQEADSEASVQALKENIDQEIKETAAQREKAAEEAYAKMTAIMLRSTGKQQQHFGLVYTNYNFIETVDTVKRDVGIAVEKCGENNPEMKDALSNRFKEWTGEIDPIMVEAQANLDNMFIAQDYATEAEIKDILQTVDKTRELSNSQIQKIPVTSPEACQYLLDKMDETQERMLQLLRTTLVSYPQLLSQPSEDDAEDNTPAKDAE